MEIENNITELHGKWISEENKVIADDTTKKIEYLIRQYLKKLAESASGWRILYQDPIDKRYWELFYPNSEWHGGGPPSLVNIEKSVAEAKYNILINDQGIETTVINKGPSAEELRAEYARAMERKDAEEIRSVLRKMELNEVSIQTFLKNNGLI